MKLGRKITLVTVAIVVIIGLATIILINYVVSNVLRQSVQDKEISLARVAASHIANPVLNGNFLTVQREMESLQEDRQLAYVFLILPDGRVLHTLPHNISPELVELNRLRSGEKYIIKSFRSDAGNIQDVGVFMLDGLDSELHIGFREDYIQTTLNRVFQTILMLTLTGVVLASVAAGWLGKYLSAPIEKLTALTRKIAGGELEHRVSILAQDEVGELAQSFNRMVVALQENMTKLQAAEEEQRIKNRELTVFNVVSKTLTLERDVRAILTDVLRELVAILDLAGAWIYLREPALEDRQTITAGVEEGEILDFQCCLCDCDLKNLQSGECLSLNSIYRNGQYFRVTGVPIYAGERVLGGMHLVSVQDLLPSDKAALLTIGGQLGTVIENVTLWQELKLREEKVSQLLEKVMVAQEDERKRIARELHDETSQSLAALAMRLKVGMGWLQRDQLRAVELLEECKNEAGRIMRELHHIIFHLRPTLLDDLGLIPALRWLAESRDWGSPIEVVVKGDWTAGRLSAQMETVLFRIGQEAISNAVKYSHADRLVIDFAIKDRQACLRIEDNGQGFAWGKGHFQASREKKPLGLLGMMERALLLGGEVRIDSQVGIGTSVTATIPLDGNNTNRGG